MTREQFAEKIRWSSIMYAIGLMNVMAMLPQLIQIIATKKTDGISVAMLVIFLALQFGFSMEGFFKRNRTLMWSMALTALMNSTVITLVLYLRHFA